MLHKHLAAKEKFNKNDQDEHVLSVSFPKDFAYNIARK